MHDPLFAIGLVVAVVVVELEDFASRCRRIG